MKPVDVELAVVLRTSLHIGTGLGLSRVLDDRTVQGPHPERPSLTLPYIPGASFKGRLRHHVRMLSAQLAFEQSLRSLLEGDLFGFADRPATLFYTDIHIDLGDPTMHAFDRAGLLKTLATSERSFVSLSRVRRVALDQRLFRLELAEHGLRLKGRITGTLLDERAEAALALLLAAIGEMSHIGGMKGRGLGAVTVTTTRVRVGETAADSSIADLLPALEELCRTQPEQ